MRPRTALILAGVSGLLAISIVAVDLQFGLQVEIQEMRDGNWNSVSGNYYRYPGAACATSEMRLVVNNDSFLSTEIPVMISYYEYGVGRMVTVLSATWNLEPNGVQSYDFTIPESAFESMDNSVKSTIQVEVYVDGSYYGTCVEEVA